MLTIRLFRVGKKNQPAYKIVVTDKRNAASRGRFVEEVGFYNPLTKQRNLNGDRVKYWLSVGAKASDTVHNMLVSDKVIEAKKVANHNIVPEKPEEAAAPEAPKTEETPATEAPADVSSEASAKGEATPAPEETPNPPAGGEEKPEAENKPEEEKKEA